MRGTLVAVVLLLGGWPVLPVLMGQPTIATGLEDGDYELCAPVRVESESKHHHGIHFMETNNTGSRINNEALYEMEAFGEKYRLRLTKKDSLISPHFTVQRFSANFTWLDEEAPDHQHCFFSGYVEGERSSVVAVSLCEGMSGIIKTSNGTLFIKPHKSDKNSSHHPKDKIPHIVYRKKENTQKKCHAGDEEKFFPTLSYPWIKNLKNTTLKHIRRKRSLAWESHLETMVVADSTMLSYHKDDLQHYVLTLMSVVATLYRDPSIANAVNIVLTKLVILEKPEDGPEVGTNAVTTLRNFCNWQHLMNQGNDSDPNHHDTAVLLTRVNICRTNKQCDTLGLADIGTICDSKRSCSIIEDSGLSTGFTIAHELGHQLGLPHDDDIRCKKFPELRARAYNVMASTLDYNTHPWSWSRCSAFILTEFLEHGFGRCLLDRPSVGSHHKRLNTMRRRQPGESYSVDKQCELVFGSGARLCPFMPACKRLWCTTRGLSQGCRSRHMPWADGTSCGHHKWCQKGECVVKRHMKGVDGNWGRWQPYGGCSRSCGGGVKKSSRKCNNPVPRNGGRYCIGENIKYKPCNIKDCPNSDDDRQHQCSRYDGKHFNFNGLPPNIKWIPKYSGISLRDRCKLYCRVAGYSVYHLLSSKVIDGTKCGPKTTDMCVNGICRRAGCDNRLGSELKPDNCGVCGGDNTTCAVIHNVYKPTSVRFGYNTIARIPSYSTAITIEQHGHQNAKDDENYLSLMNHQGEYILNGNYIVSMFKKNIKFGAARIDYSGSDQTVERINATSIIKEDIIVLVLCVGALYPPSISINYTRSLGNRTTFRWQHHGPWSNCSHICQGKRQKEVRCLRDFDGLVVPDKKCVKSEIPNVLTEECNSDCSLGWFVRTESECSSRCGAGYITREVMCGKQTENFVEEVAEDDCNFIKQSKPPNLLECTGPCAELKWKFGEWSKCSKSCSRGFQYREAICQDDTGRVYPDTECVESQRIISQSCNELPCPEWTASDWTRCSVTCGMGYRSRQVLCRQGHKVVKDVFCKRTKPATKRICDLAPCLVWYYGDWAPCSVSCGEGIQRRAVRCRSTDGYDVDDYDCNEDTRPDPTRRCEEQPCVREAPAPRPTQQTLISTEEPVYRNYIRKAVPQYIPTTTTAPTPPTTTTTTVPTTTKSTTRSKIFVKPTPSAFGSTKRIQSIAKEYRPKARVLTPIVKVSSSKDVALRHQEIFAEWRTGNWISCSRSCGRGFRERYVSCRDQNNNGVDESLCISKERPVAVESCLVSLCIEWRTGAWGHCTVSCGGGEQKRMVKCIQLDEQFGFHGFSQDCKIGQRPVSEKKCNSKKCLDPEEFDIAHISSNDVVGTKHWRVGPWGQCSQSCGGGHQRRMVVCHDEKGASNGCDKTKEPKGVQDCNAVPCPAWNNGEWSQCSVTCGYGLQERAVNCQSPDGQVLSDDKCDVPKRPSDTQECNMTECPVSGKWRVGPWSGCSVNCGHGRRFREVNCVDKKKNPVNATLCNDEKEPKKSKRCKVTRCPKWTASPWTECSVSCGQGTRARLLECKRGTRVLNPMYCEHSEKPSDQEKCSAPDCSTVTWRTGPWSRCSVTCNSGVKQRLVTCFNLTSNEQVTDRYCSQRTRPKSSRKCNQPPCPFIWSAEDWTPCSKSCSKGEQRRKVTCRRVTKEGWIIPDEIGSGCKNSNRPADYRLCSYGDCESPYRWEAQPWRKCSASCGLGKATRRVYCVDSEGKKQNRRRCKGAFRPDRKKQCFLKPCIASSCRQLRSMTSIRKDGDYRIVIQGHISEIYCKGMKRSRPKEYISLKAGWESNYAEVYGRRLLNYSSCPYNGARNINCDCAKSSYTRAGLTGFSKVRLDLETMTLITTDYTFTSTKGANPIPYGTAGDCYSAAGCPQGRFRINLTSTNFAVSNHTRWHGAGYKPVVKISAEKRNQVIEGACGGYCGHCTPDPTTGFKIDVLPP